MSSDITLAHIHGLLATFSKFAYTASESEQGSFNNEVMEKCLNLFKLDYNVVEISNQDGELSAHYPSVIIIPENEKQPATIPNTSHCFSAFFGQAQNAAASNNGSSTTTTSTTSTGARTQQETIYESSCDVARLKELIREARFARSRTRFPIPVIMYKGKYVCRSSTLSCGPEMYTRSGLNYIFNVTTKSTETSEVDKGHDDDTDAFEVEESFTDESCARDFENKPTQWALFDQLRHSDIKLLKALNVGTIVDFMVEKKKVKFGLKVTSSEKVDKEKRYSDFTIISLPYPGCEFFREFRDNNYSHESLVFDWSQTHVNADIGIPDDPITSQLLHINWDQYKMWDLVTITQNYLKLCLKYLQDNSSGLLIHCISGWDRTPLFTSLLRLSLWADGVIHQSLNANQILFLTLAYDWYLFGHDLPDRIGKGEEIFVFCFYALKYIQDEDFSVLGHRHRSKHNSSGSSSIAVLHTDGESNLEGYVFDADSRGSSFSLNSAGSHQDSNQTNASTTDGSAEYTNGNISSILNNQDSNSSIEVLQDIPNQNNSYSPLPKRRTSPVTVPITAFSRQRHESTTSSVGSWQMISQSQSGSLRSTDSGNLLPNLRSQNANSQESSGTLVEDDPFTTFNSSAGLLRRQNRLSSVRSTFYQCYCKTVGFKYKNGAETSFGVMLGNFAERVGFTQRPPT